MDKMTIEKARVNIEKAKKVKGKSLETVDAYDYSAGFIEGHKSRDAEVASWIADRDIWIKRYEEEKKRREILEKPIEPCFCPGCQDNARILKREESK